MAYKVKSVLPDQTGNANKFLKTDGTNTSWAAGGGGTGDLVSTNNLSDVANVATAAAPGTVTTSFWGCVS